jgi:uncharacterized membrane protein YoaK (UPF0700 family)
MKTPKKKYKLRKFRTYIVVCLALLVGVSIDALLHWNVTSTHILIFILNIFNFMMLATIVYEGDDI